MEPGPGGEVVLRVHHRSRHFLGAAERRSDERYVVLVVEELTAEREAVAMAEFHLRAEHRLRAFLEAGRLPGDRLGGLSQAERAGLRDDRGPPGALVGLIAFFLWL